MRYGFIISMLVCIPYAKANSLIHNSFDPDKHLEYRVGYDSNTPTWEYKDNNQYVPDDNLGYRQPRNARVRHIMRTKELIVWDVSYNFDEHGYRIMPHINRKKNTTKYLAFLGCSFVFGTGLEDKQTLPAQIAEKLPNYEVYNFGISGSGPNMMLAQIEEPEFLNILPKKPGIFIYIALDTHMERANSLYLESQWMADTPNYDYDQTGNLKRMGSIRSAHPIMITFYGWLRKVQELFFPKIHFNLPRINPKHIKYTCDIIVASQKKIKEIFPNSKFFVINHPLEGYRDEVVDCLKKNDIVFLETKMKWENNDSYRIPIDGHPSEKFNADFASVIADKIKDL